MSENWSQFQLLAIKLQFMFLFLRISMVPGKKKVVTIDAISSTQDNFGV